MDINNLLSLMGGNTNNKELMNVLSMLNLKDGGNNTANIFASALSNANPDLNKLMNLYKNNKPKGYGLAPITSFAPNEILGIMFKFFNNN